MEALSERVLDGDVLPLVLCALPLHDLAHVAAVNCKWSRVARAALLPFEPQQYCCGMPASKVPSDCGGEFAISLDGDEVVSVGYAGNDKSIALHRVTHRGHTAIGVLEGHSKSVSCVAISGDTVVSGADGGEVCVWSLGEQRKVATLSGIRPNNLDAAVETVGHGDSDVYAIAIDREAKTIYSGDCRGILCLWSLQMDASWALATHFERCAGPPECAWCVAFTDGNMLADGGEGQHLLPTSLTAGASEPLRSGTWADVLLRCPVDSGRPWTRILESDSQDQQSRHEACSWHVYALRHPDSIHSLAADGCLLATACADHAIRTWCIGRSMPNFGTCTRVLLGHINWVYSVSLRGAMLVSGGFDGLVCVWDVRPAGSHTSGLVVALRHGNQVDAVGIGRHFILSGSYAGFNGSAVNDQPSSADEDKLCIWTPCLFSHSQAAASAPPEAAHTSKATADLSSELADLRLTVAEAAASGAANGSRSLQAQPAWRGSWAGPVQRWEQLARRGSESSRGFADECEAESRALLSARES